MKIVNNGLNLLVAGLLIASVFPLVMADVKNAERLAKQAVHVISTGEIGKAELLYAQALQEDPNNRDIHLSLAELYIQLHRFEEAENIVLHGDQNYYRLWKIKGMLHQAQEKRFPTQKVEAIAAFEKALQLPGGKEDPYVISSLQVYYDAMGNSAGKKQTDNLLEMYKSSKTK